MGSRLKKNKLERKENKKIKNMIPGRPRKPESAYIMWLDEVGRDKILKENPGIGHKKLRDMATLAWSSVSVDEREQYVKKAKGAMLKYQEENNRWYQSIGGRDGFRKAKKETKMKRCGIQQNDSTVKKQDTPSNSNE